VTPAVFDVLETSRVGVPEKVDPPEFATWLKHAWALFEFDNAIDGRVTLVARGSTRRIVGSVDDTDKSPTTSSLAPKEGMVSEKVRLSNSKPVPHIWIRLNPVSNRK
jgi:hypothetical protein